MSKTIVVTGTATGLGRATVEKFAAHGWNVVATVRKVSDLETHASVDNVRTLLLDVDDEEAVEPFSQLAALQFGGVDVLVNNAGYYQMGPLEATTMDQVHRQFQTNLFGLIAMTKAFIPMFRAQGSGRIINIASITADQGYPYNSVYASSKAAVATLSEALNIEMAEFGVVVKTILPGLHATRIFTKIDTAADVPDAYRASMAKFFANNSPNGSSPSITGEVVYRAALDPDTTTVRYYSGPDAVAIPRGKRILGAESYWQEFRNAVVGDSSDLWDTLMPMPGTTPVQMEV
jgi:NAD(P)-dependent dehydrogenase (short-subunit alcohol dehydrogenase family)